MKLFVPILLIIFFINCKSQSKTKKTETVKKTELKPAFNNQVEQENYLVKDYFKRKYEKHCYETYSNEIKEIFSNEVEEVDETKLIYDDKSFNIYDINGTLKLIFNTGILYPQLISGFTSEPRKSNKELELLSISERAFYELSRGDNLSIMNLEELEFMSGSPKIKRFRFWLWWPKSANPRVYLFELTNENADKNTDLKEFIENSKLTFLKLYTILL